MSKEEDTASSNESEDPKLPEGCLARAVLDATQIWEDYPPQPKDSNKRYLMELINEEPHGEIIFSR